MSSKKKPATKHYDISIKEQFKHIFDFEGLCSAVGKVADFRDADDYIDYETIRVTVTPDCQSDFNEFKEKFKNFLNFEEINSNTHTFTLSVKGSTRSSLQVKDDLESILCDSLCEYNEEIEIN